jgi:Fe-S cluster assembly protein SufD
MTAASTLSSSDDQAAATRRSPVSPRGNATTGDRNGANDRGTAPVESRGARATSFDLAEFAIPTGREEEWRFTPLDRLRGLHDSTAALDGKVLVAINAPDEVVVESVERGDARLGRAGEPGDRVAAQAWASHAQAVIVTVPCRDGDHARHGAPAQR